MARIGAGKANFSTLFAMLVVVLVAFFSAHLADRFTDHQVFLHNLRVSLNQS
jgi:hypothetical protein